MHWCIPVCTWFTKIPLRIPFFDFWQWEKIQCVRDRYVVVFKNQNSATLHGNLTCHNTSTYLVHTSTYWYVPFSALRTSMYWVHTGTYWYVPNTLISYNRSGFQMHWQAASHWHSENDDIMIVLSVPLAIFQVVHCHGHSSSVQPEFCMRRSCLSEAARTHKRDVREGFLKKLHWGNLFRRNLILMINPTWTSSWMMINLNSVDWTGSQPVPKAYGKCCVTIKCKMKCSHLKSTHRILG